MHVLPLLPLAAGLVAALPAGQAAGSSLERRQLSRNDVAQGGTCPKVILVYARATGEMGNLGILGGVIGSALESEYGQGNVWVQGVGGAYTAGVTDNILPDGTSQAAIAEMVGLFGQAAQKCPQATIVTGGYSQGSALTAAAVRDVSDDVRSKIAGAVLFGYTKNAQNNGGIPNYPSQDVKVFCNPGDLVCSGSLIVAAPHFAYQSAASGPAPQFLIGRINAAGAGGGAGGDAGGDAGAGTDSGAGAGTGTGSDAGAGTGTGSDAGAGAGTGSNAGSGSGAGGLGGIGNLFGGGSGGLGGIGNLIGGGSAESTSGSRCWWCFFGNS